MKRWLARSFWVAAWIAWCWAGYGLWRELPRTLGPVIGKLDLHETQSFLGMLPEEPTFLTRGRLPGIVEGWRIQSWDARTLQLLRETDVPYQVTPWTWSPVTGYAVFDASRSKSRKPLAVNLKTGRRIELDGRGWEDSQIKLHADRPWAAALDRRAKPNEKIPSCDAATVLDLDSGKEVATLPRRLPRDGKFEVRNIELMPGSDLAVLECSSLNVEGKYSQWLECWRVTGGEQPVGRLENWVLHFADGALSANGRLACVHLGTVPVAVSVFDLLSGKRLLIDPPQGMFEEHFASGIWPAPRISPDGNTVVNGLGRSVYEIGPEPENCRRLWRWESPQTSVTSVDWAGGRVELLEPSATEFPHAQIEWVARRLGGSPDFGSYCVCLLHTGATLYRCDESSLDAPLAIRDGGSVVKVDPTPRWGLIALLQAILAAPLVTLWGLLRWQKWRLSRAST